jgi:hypothetical protein
MQPNPNALLTSKELAGLLRRHPSFVYGMRRQGFPMPGGTATLAEAREWLLRNPKPRARK